MQRGEGKWGFRPNLRKHESYRAVTQPAVSVEEELIPPLTPKAWHLCRVEREEVQDDHAKREIRKVNENHEAKVERQHGNPNPGTRAPGERQQDVGEFEREGPPTTRCGNAKAGVAKTKSRTNVGRASGLFSTRARALPSTHDGLTSFVTPL